MMTNTLVPKYAFTYGAALDDDSLYLCGIIRELEDQDFHHTIFWERIGGNWKRYQWKNRSYGLVAYPCDGAGTAVYLGFEGTAKVRSQVHGSSEEIIEGGNDGPSSLRTISSIRVIGDQLYVSGMRRMVYRRPLTSAIWSRFDEGVRQQRADLAIAGLYSIDGYDPLDLYGVGIGGEVWKFSKNGWSRVESPTNMTFLAVRCIPDGKVIVCGEKGALWVGSGGVWNEVVHSFSEETFNCIECWRGRCFVLSESGTAYELIMGDVPVLSVIKVDGMPSVNWVFATDRRAWFVGDISVVSLGEDGWRDESPPTALMV